MSNTFIYNQTKMAPSVLYSFILFKSRQSSLFEASRKHIFFIFLKANESIITITELIA